MNRFLRLTLMFSFLLHPALSSGEEESILEIRKQYDQIESTKMDSTTIKFEFEDDPQAGKVTFWEENGQIRKIVLDTESEHGGSTESFFYREGKLFFVLKADSMWRFSGNTLPDGQSETIDSLKEMRFYFQDGNCIKALAREAQNTKADLLGKQISGLENKPFSDAAVISEVKEKGAAIFGLKGILG